MWAKLFVFLEKVLIRPLEWVCDKGKVWTVLAIMFSVVGWAGFIVSGLIGVALAFQGDWTVLARSSPLIIFGAGLWYTGLLGNKAARYRFTEWDWSSFGLGEASYRNIPIPEFALATAVRVKESLPTAKLSIEILMANERQLADPFLVMELAGQKFYLEVWNESKFEGRAPASS